MKPEYEKMKPEYEKPIAVPLGEALKGSGQCNAGSGVEPLIGSGDPPCRSGTNPINPYCDFGTNGRV